MPGHKVEKNNLINPVLFEIVVLDVPKQNLEKIRSLLSSFGQDFHLDDRNKIWISSGYITNIKKAVKKTKSIDIRKINYPAITQIKINEAEIPTIEACILFQAAGIDYAIQGNVLYVSKQFFS